MKTRKIGLLLILTLVAILVIDLFIISFSPKAAISNTSMSEALEKSDIHTADILHTDEWGGRGMAIYKDQADNQLKVGLFEKSEQGWRFLVQNGVDRELARSEQISLYTCDLENGFKGMTIPNFYFEYGVVHNPNIESLNLHVLGDVDKPATQAQIVNVDGVKFWYVFRGEKDIYHTQGISASGEVIYDPGFGKDLSASQEAMSKLVADVEALNADFMLTPKVAYRDHRDDLSANLEDNSPEMASLLKGLKEEDPGVAGWLVGFANSEKVVFYNHAYMLTYDIPNRRFSSAIDLMSIDAGHIQGSVVTCFSFSPDGDYVLIDNGSSDSDPSWAATMYLADLQTGSVQEIDSVNYAKIANSWSNNSRYFAYADRTGSNVTIYEVATGTTGITRLEIFNQGEVKRVLVTDAGDVVVEADSIFLLTKGQDKTYSYRDLGIQGNILTVNESELVYYTAETIKEYNLSTGGTTVVQNMEKGLVLSTVTREQAVFTSEKGSTSVVYNFRDKSLHEYGYTSESSHELLQWSLAPDSKHGVVLDGWGYRVIDDQGNQERIQVENDNSLSFDGGWIDSHTFVVVLIKGGSNGMAGDLKIAAYDLEAKQRKILYEQ